MAHSEDGLTNTRKQLATQEVLAEFFKTTDEKYSHEEGWFTIHDVARAKQITYRRAEKLVFEYLDKGHIEEVREGRWKYYRIIGDAPPI